MAQMVKNLPTVPETRVQPLGREDPLEKGQEEARLSKGLQGQYAQALLKHWAVSSPAPL